MVGLYHAFVRGHNRDTRSHKLFIVVSGGCSKASDEFYNVVLDCHGHATAGECALSEEAWWLRRACYRSRCRIIAECAKAFGIRTQTIADIHSMSFLDHCNGRADCPVQDDDDGEENFGDDDASHTVNGSLTTTNNTADAVVRMAVATIDTVCQDLVISQVCELHVSGLTKMHNTEATQHSKKTGGQCCYGVRWMRKRCQHQKWGIVLDAPF